MSTFSLNSTSAPVRVVVIAAAAVNGDVAGEESGAISVHSVSSLVVSWMCLNARATFQFHFEGVFRSNFANSSLQKTDLTTVSSRFTSKRRFHIVFLVSLRKNFHERCCELHAQLYFESCTFSFTTYFEIQFHFI